MQGVTTFEAVLTTWDIVTLIFQVPGFVGISKMDLIIPVLNVKLSQMCLTVQEIKYSLC